jgi:tetratricopeptide (TPR) repeat protein
MRLALLLACATVCLSTAKSQCVGPPAIEAKIQSDPGADSYAEMGVWFAGQQQFECANQSFRSALKYDPASAKLNYFLGLSLHSSGQDDASIAPLKQSVAADAKAIQPRLLLAMILQNQGKRSDAEEQWKAALQIDPASKDALDGLSTLMIDSGDAVGAIGLLRNATRDEDLDVDLIRAYGQARMLDDAATLAEQALAANPSSLRLTNVMVTVLVQQHRFLQAAALLKKYVELHPSDSAAQIAYLSALVLNKDFATARTLGAKLLVAAPHDFQVLYLNGILEREAGAYAQARDHELEAIKLDPDNYGARYNLGAALAHLDDNAGAKVQLEKAIALDGSQPEAHFQLSSVLRALGDAKGSQEQLTTYQQLARAGTNQARADTEADLAAQKLAAGDTQQAISLYKEAVANTPQDALLNYRLAVALDKAGDTAGERTALESAVNIDPTLAIAQNQLGFLLSRSGEQGAAEAHFRSAVAAAPAFIEAWVNLAATLGQEQHLPEAKEAIATALQIDPANAQALELSKALNTTSHP